MSRLYASPLDQVQLGKSALCPRALIVIPCLNEASALGDVVGKLRAQDFGRILDLEIAVIDDGSSDGTAEVARSLGVRIVRQCDNLGIGASVQTGLRLAARGGFDFAIQVDGDGQHLASELPCLIAGLEQQPEPDLVIGSRFLSSGGWKSSVPRRVGIRWLSWVLRLVMGVRVKDPTSGFRLFGPRALALFEHDYPYDYPEPESLAIASAAGLRILEVPVRMAPRLFGASSIRGLSGAYYLLKVTMAVLLTSARTLGGRRH